MNFLKSSLTILCLSIIFSLSSCGNSQFPQENDFLLEATYTDNIELGDTVLFQCALTNNSLKTLKIDHGSQIINYELDGKGEIISGKGIIEYMSSGQTFERTISCTFNEKGNHVIKIFSEFNVLNSSKSKSKKYRIEKEFIINVK